MIVDLKDHIGALSGGLRRYWVGQPSTWYVAIRWEAASNNSTAFLSTASDDNGAMVYRFDFKADASGDVNKLFDIPISGYGYALITLPSTGGHAPTTGWDLTILDRWGFDILRGKGANRTTANQEAALNLAAGEPLPLLASGEWRFVVANAGANATGCVKLVVLPRI